MAKICCMCKVEKTPESFSRNGRSSDGLQTACKDCMNSYARSPENKKRRSLQAKERWRNGKIRDDRYQELYGITVQDYYRMFFEQGEVCDICKKPGKEGRPLCVDHDHKIQCKNGVRGLLCDNCNKAIGHILDDENLALKIHGYLQKHKLQQEIASDGET